MNAKLAVLSPGKAGISCVVALTVPAGLDWSVRGSVSMATDCCNHDNLSQEPSDWSAAALTLASSSFCQVRFCDHVEEFFTSCGEEEEDRHGPWEELARDRCRFLRRCQEVEQSIAYCLQPQHRSLVYRRLTVLHVQDAWGPSTIPWESLNHHPRSPWWWGDDSCEAEQPVEGLTSWLWTRGPVRRYHSGLIQWSVGDGLNSFLEAMNVSHLSCVSALCLCRCSCVRHTNKLLFTSPDMDQSGVSTKSLIQLSGFFQLVRLQSFIIKLVESTRSCALVTIWTAT